MGTLTLRGSVVCPHPVPDPSLRLFLFHHAGGSHLLYRDWAREFPPDWEVCLPNAPGRAQLRDRPALDCVEDLVRHFHHDLGPLLDRPFAFFGHSMGGLVAVELALRLAAEGGRRPVWLGLSSCGVPRLADAQREEGRHRYQISDVELRGWLGSVGGTPTEILDNEGLWGLFEPVIRSDFKLVDTWARDPGTCSLPMPVTLFGGDQDTVVAPSRLAAWAEHSPFVDGPYLYSGGHFYVRDHRAAMARKITEAVLSARSAAHRPRR